MRPDYCPLGNEPCQSLCDKPCSARLLQRNPLQWHKAPVKTEWGEGMIEALVEIDKDHTLKLYCEHDQAARVEAMLGAREPLTNQEIMREYAALWPFLRSEDHVLAQDILKFARAIERAHGIGGEE